MKVAPLIGAALVIYVAIPGSNQGKGEPTFCKGVDGKRYKKGESYEDKENCIRYTCTKIQNKLKMKKENIIPCTGDISTIVEISQKTKRTITDTNLNTVINFNVHNGMGSDCYSKYSKIYPYPAARGKSLSECQTICTNNPECGAILMLKASAESGGSTSCYMVKPNNLFNEGTCTWGSGSYNAYEKKFTVLIYKVYKAMDSSCYSKYTKISPYPAASSKSLSECQTICSDEPECGAILMKKSSVENGGTTYCYMIKPNNLFNEGTCTWGNGNYNAYEKKVTGCVKDDNIDYYGNDIPDKNGIVNGLEGCIKWCGDTTACKYWTFAKSNQRCWLKTSDSDKRENSDTISGTKNCETVCTADATNEAACFCKSATGGAGEDCTPEQKCNGDGTCQDVCTADATNEASCFCKSATGGAGEACTPGQKCNGDGTCQDESEPDLAANMTAIEASMQFLNDSMESIERKFEALQNNMQFLNDSMESIERKFEALQNSMESILEVITAVQSTSKNLGTCMSDFSSSDCPDSAPGKVGVVDGISTNKAGVTSAKADINTNKAGMNTNKASINTNKAGINTNKADINTNKAGIMENKAAITAHHVCAILYEDKEYGGSSFNIYTNDPISNLRDIGWNDRISSVRVTEGNILHAFEHRDYIGIELEITSDTSVFNRDNYFSSLQCYEQGSATTTSISTTEITDPVLVCAILYEDKEYGGSSFNIYTNDPISNLRDIGWNDRISSVRVTEGSILHAFEHRDYIGIELEITSDTSVFNRDNYFSSLQCYEQVCAILYEDKEYGGSSFNIYTNDTISNLRDIGWNDRISSVRVTEGSILHAFEHGDYIGIELEITSDTSVFNRDNYFSSLQCYEQGSATTTSISTTEITDPVLGRRPMSINKTRNQKPNEN